MTQSIDLTYYDKSTFLIRHLSPHAGLPFRTVYGPLEILSPTAEALAVELTISFLDRLYSAIDWSAASGVKIRSSSFPRALMTVIGAGSWIASLGVPDTLDPVVRERIDGHMLNSRPIFDLALDEPAMALFRPYEAALRRQGRSLFECPLSDETTRLIAKWTTSNTDAALAELARDLNPAYIPMQDQPRWAPLSNYRSEIQRSVARSLVQLAGKVGVSVTPALSDFILPPEKWLGRPMSEYEKWKEFSRVTDEILSARSLRHISAIQDLVRASLSNTDVPYEIWVTHRRPLQVALAAMLGQTGMETRGDVSTVGPYIPPGGVVAVKSRRADVMQIVVDPFGPGRQTIYQSREFFDPDWRTWTVEPSDGTQLWEPDSRRTNHCDLQ